MELLNQIKTTDHENIAQEQYKVKVSIYIIRKEDALWGKCQKRKF